jgi:hypothetical protein
MTATTTDPQSPAKLPSLGEALDITVTTDPRETTISVLFPSGVWDMVYQDGIFAQAYSASTLAGSAFTLRRNGGWPPGVQFAPKVKEQSTSSTAGDLTPHLGPTAWYVLDPISQLTDQSGNGNTLSVISASSAIAGPAVGYVAAASGRWRRTGNVAFRTSGAVSAIALLNRAGDASHHPWFAGAEDSGASFATWWKFGVNDDGSIIYACDRSGVSLFATLAPAGTVPLTGFNVVGCVRSASAVVSAYLNGVAVGTPYSQGAASTGGSNAWLAIGQDAFSSLPNQALMVIGVWAGSALSPADMLSLYHRLRGL